MFQIFVCSASSILQWSFYRYTLETIDETIAEHTALVLGHYAKRYVAFVTLLSPELCLF